MSFQRINPKRNKMTNQKSIPYHQRSIQPSPTENKEESALSKNKMSKLMRKLAQNKEETIENLHEHLRIAMMLELSTIPPYLCAIYTMKTGDTTDANYKATYGDNAEAASLIKSVMMEEMLHLTLAGNILNAVGGQVKINEAKYLPEYPTALPDSSGKFLVHLAKFEKSTIRTFLRIEQPTPPLAKPKIDDYDTIGQFYHAIAQLMKKLEASAKKSKQTIFTGDSKLQIDESYYYGGGGRVISVTDLDSAMDAIDVILEQGEGSQTTIYDTDHSEFGQIKELAHFFKFNEIYEEQRYAACQNDPKEAPAGTKMDIRYDQVYDMGTDVKTDDFVSDELKEMSADFNAMYKDLLNGLQDAFSGNQQAFIQAVAGMYQMKYKAMELIKNPIPGKKINAGPTFEFSNK
jgi:hypothetical protein